MTLHYTFEAMGEVLASPAEHIAYGWYEPHCREGMCEYDFEYEVTPDDDDYWDFLMSTMGEAPWTKEQSAAAKELFDHLSKEDLLNTEALEDDDKFVRFMKDKYEDEAHDEFDRQER